MGLYITQTYSVISLLCHIAAVLLPSIYVTVNL